MHFTHPLPKQLRMSALHWAASFPKQVVLTMQASAILLFAVCLQASAAGLGQTVSFTGKDVPLKTVFTSIKKQTGYGVFYQNGEAATLEGASTVTLDLKNVALDLFLQVALRNQPLEYSMEGTTIFIKKKEARSTLSVEAGPGAPIGEIHGRVTNDKGEPLVNANITVKRTGHGTITDANGNFSLHNVNTDDIITVTFIGYKPQNISIQDRSSLIVFMEPATNDLDKVVVQAYGTTTQRLATGNIGVVRAEDIAKQPVMNVLQAVQGQVPGVVVTSTSGYASGVVKVEIRGRNVINDFPSDPLYIIDGVPLTILDLTGQSTYDNGSQGVIQSTVPSPANGQSPFFNINPLDIESIEVLKDADATAIYGSRGNNGVILITTKKGKAGKTHFDLNLYTGFSKVPRYYHMLNTKQYLTMREEALANDGLPVDANNAPDLAVWDTSRYTDWQKYLWGGMGKQTDAQCSLSGGDARTTFRVAAGYRYQTEILTSSGNVQRGSFSFDINLKSLDQRFAMSLTGIYTFTSNNMIGVPGAINLPPNAPSIWDKKGNLNFTGWVPFDGEFPFGPLLQPYSATTNLLNGNLLLKYIIHKGLTFKTNFGYNNSQNSQSFTTPIISQDPLYNPTGTVQFGNTYFHNAIIEPQLDYYVIIGKSKLSALAGATIQTNTTSSNFLEGLGYKNDALLGSVNNAQNQVSGNALSKYKYEAIFGPITYNWKDRFILNLNGRRDGSSKFGPGKQFGNFGSIGGAWIFSEEKWIKTALPLISFGKLRGSYGTSGGDQIADYLYLTHWSFGRFSYNNVQPLNPLGHTDSLLHWQVNKKLEVSLDIGLAKDKITLSATWYQNRCNNQLIPYPTAYFTGFSAVASNSPANVQNTGWEFLLNAKIIDHSIFKWNAKFNIGINRNKLLAYPNLSQSPYAGLYIVGKPLNIRRLLHNTGVDPQTGLYTFEDRDKDGQITIDISGKTSDDRYIYNLNPKFDGGFINNFTYKNWQLSLFFYFKKQIGANALASLSAPGDNTNQPLSALARWQSPGQITNVAKFTTNPYGDPSYQYFRQFSDAVYSDMSFIKLRNLSLSYTLPEKLTKPNKIDNINIYIQGENIFTITHYNGLDPEIPGFDNLPFARTITLGISCNF